jgi:hypothetical protein
MGDAVPDRLFWAGNDDDDDGEGEGDDAPADGDEPPASSTIVRAATRR